MCEHSQEKLGKGIWKLEVLSRFCAQSQAARRAWRNAGSPTTGPLFEEKEVYVGLLAKFVAEKNMIRLRELKDVQI